MRALLLMGAMSLGLMAPAFARPQLSTGSIGWIEKSDIDCPQTSDHICVVRKNLASTFEDADEEKYRVRAGTELNILNERGGRVEVAIIIPLDWDDRPGFKGQLRPLTPCHLKFTGGVPQIVSLVCRIASVTQGDGY
jgi:hypothetical protein